MNKGFTQNTGIEKIFIVKYELVHSMMEMKRVVKESHNLHAFIEFEEARKYLEVAMKSFINPHMEKFKILVNVEEKCKDNILYCEKFKLAGITENNKSQTKLFTFYIESMNLK